MRGSDMFDQFTDGVAVETCEARELPFSHTAGLPNERKTELFGCSIRREVCNDCKVGLFEGLCTDYAHTLQVTQLFIDVKMCEVECNVEKFAPPPLQLGKWKGTKWEQIRLCPEHALYKVAP